MNTKLIKKISIFLLVMALLFIWGCNGNPKPNPQEKNDEAPELPGSFTEIEEDILTVMLSIDGVTGLEKAMEEVEKGKQEVELESDVELDAEEKEEPAKEAIDINMFIHEEALIIPLLEEEDVESDIVQIEELPNDIENIWYQIEILVAGIHRKWNVLEPQLRKAGASSDDVETFENKLGDASISVSNKEILTSLLEFNELTSCLNDFRGHFSSKAPQEIYEVKYRVRQSVLMASLEDFEEAENEINEAEEIGDSLKQRLVEKNEGDGFQQFKLSIEDYKNELEEENFHLTQVKGAIIIKNIEQIIDIFESNSH
ncbi:hypothetical protein [Alkaliphilus peptidifermentans]|uniref:Uncharacterized protein n=1 Tax=Alkaliphilus peptidifermentans DSM 18978 TaxID=1120976 RepID=A0A1G5GD11_9FIRM|nr:hypothetical protein [Alkaliphilus peptidifermentans]SCY49486.1 hypothetical protein SAMN03080606_01647 [Alkaliphilus peptidifermentans DSM 18978]